jgi:hypothetical protein
MAGPTSSASLLDLSRSSSAEGQVRGQLYVQEQPSSLGRDQEGRDRDNSYSVSPAQSNPRNSVVNATGPMASRSNNKPIVGTKLMLLKLGVGITGEIFNEVPGVKGVTLVFYKLINRMEV